MTDKSLAVRSHKAKPVSEAAALIQVIDRAARDPSVDIDKLERLLQMAERIRTSGAKAAYAAALADLQPDLPTIQERGAIKKSNGTVQSTYALWEDVVEAIGPVLSRHGFAITFRTNNQDQKVSVTGVLSHRAGHSEETTLHLPVDASDFRNLVQSIGSSVSYGKRYTAMALLNLRSGISEDDDGQRGGSGETISESQVADIKAKLEEVQGNRESFLKYIGVDKFESILAANYDSVVKTISAKRGRR